MAYDQASPAELSQDESKALFSHVMWLVAVTAGVFALGCYAGRDLSIGWSIGGWIAGLLCVLGLNLAARRSGTGLSLGLLLAMGLFLGLAMGPTVAYYSGSSPAALWRAAGATALFMAGFGAYGYATRRDLTAVGRIAFFALIGLIVFGVILIFVKIPGADLVYSVIGLVVFAGLTIWDFQRLRRSRGLASAPLIAASIFLDAMNVFFFFLRIFGGGRD